MDSPKILSFSSARIISRIIGIALVCMIVLCRLVCRIDRISLVCMVIHLRLCMGVS